MQERLTAAAPTVPPWARQPWMMPPLSSTSRVMKIGITSDELNMREMSMVAYWKIRQELLRVDGVANVMIYGEQIKQQQVYVDPRKLAENGVSLEQVMDQTADSLDAGLLRYSEGAVIGTGGFVETGGQRLDVRQVLPITNPDDLAKIPLEGGNGERLTLEDVATVGYGHQPLSGDAVINDGQGLMLIVQKFPNANTLEATRGGEEAIDEMRQGLPGIEIDTTIFRPATFIETAIDNLTTALLLGVLLVVLILAAFLFEWRTAFISLIAIPLSLLAAVLVLQELGAVINVMIIAGLVVSIGVVVDDAIIDVENIVRRLRQNRSEGTGKSMLAIVLDASVEVRTAITYATLINVVAVVPVFFLPGLSGAFFKPLVLSYGLAVLVSMIVALTVTPALCLILLSRGHRHEESPLLRVLKRGYGAALARIIRTPRPAVGIATTCLLAGVLVFPTLGTILLPDFKERDFLMHWLSKPGTSLAEEYRISVRACKDLQEIPGVRNCGSHIGQAFLSDEPYGVDFGENWISISPEVDYDKTLAAVQETVDSYPGLYRDVQTYLRERVKEVLTGTSNAVVVRISGPELGVLRAKSDEISKRIAPIDGVVDAHADLAEDIPHIQVKVDLAGAQRYGLKPGDVRRQAGVLV
ncbi:MAG TPA: efflux RND transporter permease subunit, partial [Rubrobacteraceae bacterium]|nr:efflux RND transporter permease subunit [Rubrobacteraceae bacterium]